MTMADRDVVPQATDSALDAMALVAARRSALGRWTAVRELHDSLPEVAAIVTSLGADTLAGSAPEATAWSLVVSDALRLRLVQPGISTAHDAVVVVLEPVLATGAGLARTAAAVRDAGARSVHGIVGESVALVPDGAVLGLDSLHVLRS